MSSTYPGDVEYYLERAQSCLDSALAESRDRLGTVTEAYDKGYQDGWNAVASPSRRQLTGKQFLARMMTQVSPDSAAWAELHALCERGFGNSVEVTDE